MPIQNLAIFRAYPRLQVRFGDARSRNDMEIGSTCMMTDEHRTIGAEMSMLSS